MRSLTLTTEQMAGLALGLGSDEALAQLVSGRLSKRRMLVLGAVRRAWEAGIPVGTASELLAAVHDRAPSALDAVLTHPQIDAWGAGFPTTMDVGYLAALAASAAIRARFPFTMDIPSPDGGIHLPGLGTATTTGARAEVAHDGDTLFVDGEPALLDPLAVIDLTDLDGPVVTVEAADPYRAQYGAGLADMPDRFPGLWRAAWRVLIAHHPDHARAIRALVTSFVLLEDPGQDAERSATSARAGGAIAVAPPRGADALALLVLHETQHLKLNALLDLVDLDLPDDRQVFHAPWRTDARPLRGLLHGAYAHLGVADFWRSRHPRQFAYWREQTMRATETLARSGGLTREGLDFVAGMRRTLNGWTAAPVPEADRRLVDLCVRVADATWRLTNRVTAPAAVAALVKAWRDRQPAPSESADEPIRRPGGEARIVAAIRTDRPDLPEPDLALLAGRYEAAADGYARRIRSGAVADDWAGLIVALGGLPRAEVARDVYEALAPGERPDPRDIVQWCRAG